MKIFLWVVSIMIKHNQYLNRINSAAHYHRSLPKSYHEQVQAKRSVFVTAFSTKRAFNLSPKLDRKISLNESSSKYNPRSFHQADAKKNTLLWQNRDHLNDLKHKKYAQGWKKYEINDNLVRARKQVDHALMWNTTEKTFPFKIVRSLSTQTLKKKGQVEQKRKEMIQRHQLNPFGSLAFDSEYLD